MIWLYVLGGLVAWFCVSYILHVYVYRVGQLVASTFPNGMKMHHVSGDSGNSFVYKEIFVDKAYFKHGISLDGVKNPVVIDAGANVGLFSLFIASNFPTARVFGAEPVPLLHEAAILNNALYKDRVKLFRGGLGKAPSHAEFDFDPTFSAGTSMHKEAITKPMLAAGIPAMLRATIMDFGLVGNLPKWVANISDKILATPVLNYIVLVLCLPLILLFVVYYMACPRKIHVSCDIVTIPQLLEHFNVKPDELAAIDFVKIDVEGAEWDVLLGISDELWAKVQQIIVEVHNLENSSRLDAVKSLLRSKGFTNVVQDEEEFELHKILDMGTIFATRSAAPPSKIKAATTSPLTPRSKAREASSKASKKSS